MKRFIKLIKEKWLKQTSLTIALIAIIICIFTVTNVVINNLDLKPIDFTREKIFSLSEDSKNEIKKVEQNVTVYFFGFNEEETPVVLGKQYRDENDKIDVQIVTTTSRPDLATEYGISSGERLIAVSSSQRYKVIDENELYTYDSSSAQSIDVTEQKITNAILDVTIVSKPKVYFLTGHNEYGISSSQTMHLLYQYIVNDVNDVNSLDLLSSDMPETCDVLIIASPQKDFTDIETQKIQTYINNGGKIIWMQDPYIDIQNYDPANFKNINTILDQFGISFSKGVVFEQDADNMINGMPGWIMPNLVYNEIVNDLYTDGKLIMTYAGKINVAPAEKLNELGVRASTFIKTSEKAYYKEKIDENATFLTKSEGDEQGVFNLGEILIKKIDDEKSATLVAYSSALFVSNEVIPIGQAQTTPIALRNNKDILLNTVAYLSNREDAIRIRKDVGMVSFETPTKTQAFIVRTIIYAVPVMFLCTGCVVTIFRRRRK